MESRVKSIVVVSAADEPEKIPIWYQVELEDESEPFELHHNWVRRHGELKIGDLVEYEIDPQHQIINLRRKQE